MRLRILLILFFSVLANSFCLQAFSQSPAPDPDIYITNGIVYSSLVDSNFTYIGGEFTYVGPNKGYGGKFTTASYAPDKNFPKVNDNIRAITPDGIGGWYIGGDFTQVGAYTRNRIAHINSDGTVDVLWDPNANRPVYSIIVTGSEVIVGGKFTTIGGQSRNRLAKLNNTTGAADLLWQPEVSTYLNDTTTTIYSFAISGTDLFLCGNFDGINSVYCRRLAKINIASGTVSPTFTPAPFLPVYSITIIGTDLYVAGSFDTDPIGGLVRKRLAKLNLTTGAADPAFSPNPDGTYAGTVIADGNDLYVGGNFTSIGGVSRNGIAKLDRFTGVADAIWDANLNSNSLVNAIIVNGSDIFIGGGFANIGGLPRNSIAKLNTITGAADPVWDPNAYGNVYAIGQNGSDLYVGGDYYSIGGRTMNRIAKINNITGVVDTNWNPNANSFVNSIVINNNDLYAGGIFTTMGGLTRNRLAKINKTTGSVDTMWNPNANNEVYDLVLNSNNLYVAGNFTTIGGQTRNYIAKINNTTGDADATWNPNSNGPVLSIATDGSDIYAGGAFSNIGSLSRNNIAKLNNTNGDADAAWDANANSFVYSIAVSGSDIYAGGNFNSIGGQSRSKIAKLNNTSGAADLTWNANVNNTGYVLAITVSGSDVYVGGDFTNIGGFPRNYIARLSNVTGAADLAWYPNANAGVNTISVSGGDVYVGGGFTTMGGNQKRYFALFTERVLPVELSSFTSSVDKQNVTLSWNTISEQNNLGFEIERKLSESEWKKIGFVKGSGTTNQAHNYIFTDNNLSSGKYSYRLKQIDYNGNYKYFYLQNEITIGIPKVFNLSQNYPNPFNPSTKINFSIPIDSKITLKIFDVTGREKAVILNDELKRSGYYTIEFNGERLSSGIYFYSIKIDNFIQTKKMILIK